MKKSTKIISALVSILVIFLGSFVLLKSCDSKTVDKSSSYHKTSKTTQSSTKDKKDTKSSTKKSDKDSTTTPTTEASSSRVTESKSQTEAQVSPSENNIPQQGSETETTTQPQGGTGGWEATSGTLELTKETPVYAEPNKESEVVYMHSKGNIEWDGYFYDNGEWWYMFLEKGGNEATRFYIAYSDVGY
ncbi:hypothetical protein [Streptococcus merionis]|uniref:hypothetical protein n=1 Tax=Streptococcus merionis TaxID=400065 RepID=UPI003512A2AC